MTKMQRDKGASFERWVVRYFKARGFHAERTAPMQAGESGEYGDVLVTWAMSPVYGGASQRLLLECKCHADLPAYLWEPDPFHKRPVPQYLLDWLQGNDAVVFKGNGQNRPPMVFHFASSGSKEYTCYWYTVTPLAEYIEGLK